MKLFLIHLFVGIGIVVVQTTVFTIPQCQGFFYDLLIPFVVFVRLSLPIRESMALVLPIGFIMDLFSGGTFGLYLSLYFWIFLGVQGISSYFDVKGTLFRSLLIGLCVLLQNILFFTFSVFPGELIAALVPHLGRVLWQTFFGVVTGPAIMKCLERVQRHFSPPQQETRSAGKDWLAL